MATNFRAPKSVDELAESLSASQFTPKTDAELRAQAETMYKNQRDQAILSAQQSHDSSVAALNSQLAALDTAYARQAEQQKRATAASRANADRQSLSRGMQRSSYNNATLANIDLAGEKALAQIAQNQTNDVNSVNSQISQLQQQLQQNISSANSSFENSVLAKLAELQADQYSKQQTAQATNNDILMQLYQLQKNAESSKTSGRGGRTRTYSPSTRTPAATPTVADDGLDKDLLGTTKLPSASKVFNVNPKFVATNTQARYMDRIPTSAKTQPKTTTNGPVLPLNTMKKKATQNKLKSGALLN